jgi:hypothetical protein
MNIWNIIVNHFENIMQSNEKYRTILDHITLCDNTNNILLYCTVGFPLDLFVDEVIKRLYNIKNNCIQKSQFTWNKSVIYIENQYFIEINLLNPDTPKNLDCISDFILHIIKAKSITQKKHLIIIKHIEYLQGNFFEFRILLERYSQNATFLCTTHAISHIETPIKSRFSIFRVPLFTHQEILNIFDTYLNKPLNQHLKDIQTRNIIKAIYIADLEQVPEASQILTKEFCTYNYPPLYELVKSYNKNKDMLEEIRGISYKCCQYNVSIMDLVEDFIKIIDDPALDFVNKKYSKLPKKKVPEAKLALKTEVIQTGSHIDNMLCQTNKGREPIYIEYFLCQLLL